MNLDELEALLCNAADETDCPRLAQLLIAMVLFADDIALFSYSEKGQQWQLDILQEFCAARGLKVNVQKTKTMVFEPRKLHTSPFSYAGANIEQVDVFKYLSVTMHGHMRSLDSHRHPLSSSQESYVLSAAAMSPVAHT